jgi:RimJ/RimL family protein N-acetyltransferase
VAIHCRDDVDDTYENAITVAPASQHRGIASEAIPEILLYLFTTGNVHRDTASCDARNSPAARLFVGAGMRKESRQIDVEFFKEEWITLDSYAIVKAKHASGARPTDQST